MNKGDSGGSTNWKRIRKERQRREGCMKVEESRGKERIRYKMRIREWRRKLKMNG